MTTLTQARQELETRIIKEAGCNPAFRQRLLDDPKGTIADFLGATLPPGMTITVLEEQPGQHYLVLPPAPPAVDALPLDELDLALVGGGRTLRPMEGKWCNKNPCTNDYEESRKSGSRSSC
jgi:hypothetical protein